MPLVVEPVAAPTDDARALISELDAELNGAYSPQQRLLRETPRVTPAAVTTPGSEPSGDDPDPSPTSTTLFFFRSTPK